MPPECYTDYVVVQDGHAPESALLGTFCGDEIPPVVHSTSNKLLVKFRSDGYEQYTGFLATFQKVVGKWNG